MSAERQTPMRRNKSQASTEPGAVRPKRPRKGKASAPTRDSRGARSGPQTAPIPRPAQRPARPTSARQAKARAKARKAKSPKVLRPPLRDRLVARLTSVDLRPRTLASKVPFVVLVIGSLAVGLGVTLWLSTDAAERSYQLGNARVRNQILQQQKEALERKVLEGQAAPALAEAARKLGMIPTRDTAHLVQDPSGNWVVVGTPKPAEGTPPPPLNTKLPDDKPPSPKPPANPVETPVLVAPGAGALPLPASGPEVLVRAPDGASTVGTQHLPGVGGPAAPGAPQPQAPGPVPGPLPAPAAEPPAPAAGPPAAVPEPAAPAVPPAAVPPTVAPPGEQFGPVTVTTPGAAR